MKIKRGDKMKNRKILHNITQGMYVLTTSEGGCIVDAVSQVSSSEFPLISIAVMKENNTNHLMQKEGKFALSILGCAYHNKFSWIYYL